MYARQEFCLEASWQITRLKSTSGLHWTLEQERPPLLAKKPVDKSGIAQSGAKTYHPLSKWFFIRVYNNNGNSFPVFPIKMSWGKLNRARRPIGGRHVSYRSCSGASGNFDCICMEKTDVENSYGQSRSSHSHNRWNLTGSSRDLCKTRVDFWARRESLIRNCEVKITPWAHTEE
jgi:hypothetical protein